MRLIYRFSFAAKGSLNFILLLNMSDPDCIVLSFFGAVGDTKTSVGTSLGCSPFISIEALGASICAFTVPVKHTTTPSVMSHNVMGEIVFKGSISFLKM